MRPYLFYCSASLCLRPQPSFTVIVDWKARRATGSEGVKGRSSPNFFFFLASVAQHLSSPKSCHGRRLLREREGFLKPPQTERCKGDIPFYQLTRADLNQAVKVMGRRNMGTARPPLPPGARTPGVNLVCGDAAQLAGPGQPTTRVSGPGWPAPRACVRPAAWTSARSGTRRPLTGLWAFSFSS